MGDLVKHWARFYCYLSDEQGVWRITLRHVSWKYYPKSHFWGDYCGHVHENRVLKIIFAEVHLIGCREAVPCSRSMHECTAESVSMRQPLYLVATMATASRLFGAR